MEEKRSKTLRELAAELVGQKPEDLLTFALYPGGVTLVGKDGRKVRLHREPLVGWQVDEVIEARPKEDVGGQKTEDGGREIADGGQKTGDGGQKTEVRVRKKGGKQ